MKTHKLFDGLPLSVQSPLPDVAISSVVEDSRKVLHGSLYVAVKGERVDGHSFIREAIKAGAAIIVGSEDIHGLTVPYVRVEDSRLALAHLSASFRGFPARKLVVIGITGTDGKTTTAQLIFNILTEAKCKTGMVSTVKAVIGDQSLDTGYHVTTPAAPDVQEYFAHMVDNGLSHAVIEATSHGLKQQRVAACEFDAGVVTNITHEHLDYHGSYEEYRAAKGILFQSLGKSSKQKSPPPFAVLNRDDQSYQYLRSLCSVPQITYGLSAETEFRAVDIVQREDGQGFNIYWGKTSTPIFCKLPGTFNVSNCTAAFAATVGGLGIHPEAARKGISRTSGIPGRMEKIDLGQEFIAMVDFAHTPNALDVAIKTARNMVKARVITVFGSAGLRDKQKRMMMAEISCRHADLTILTAEDPRTESLNQILAEMAVGAEAGSGVEKETFWRIPDRREAIRYAVSLAKPGDIVLVCGKGHEQSMCFRETEYAWDDRIALSAALSEFLGIHGPQMPYLPEC